MKKRLFFIFALPLILATGSWAAVIDLSKLANYTNYEAKNGDYLSKGFHALLVLVLSIGKNKH